MLKQNASSPNVASSGSKLRPRCMGRRLLVQRSPERGNRDHSPCTRCAVLEKPEQPWRYRESWADSASRSVHPGRRLTRLTFEQRRNIDAGYRSPLHFLELWSITGALSCRSGSMTTVLRLPRTGIIYWLVPSEKTFDSTAVPFPPTHMSNFLPVRFYGSQGNVLA